MIPRYSRPLMEKIWSNENRFKIWFEIENEGHIANGSYSLDKKRFYFSFI